MLHLRAHHFVCLYFYQGKGYSREFEKNIKDLLVRAKNSEKIKVVRGADDVCRYCPSLENNKCGGNDNTERLIKRLDVMACNYLFIEVGDVVMWKDMKAKVKFAPERWFSEFCSFCDWEKICGFIRTMEDYYYDN